MIRTAPPPMKTMSPRRAYLLVAGGDPSPFVELEMPYFLTWNPHTLASFDLLRPRKATISAIIEWSSDRELCLWRKDLSVSVRPIRAIHGELLASIRGSRLKHLAISLLASFRPRSRATGYMCVPRGRCPLRVRSHRAVPARGPLRRTANCRYRSQRDSRRVEQFLRSSSRIRSRIRTPVAS